MTGNLVLLGLAAGTTNASLAISAGLAFLGYAIGTAIGAFVTDSRHIRVPAALLVELALLVAFTAVWEALGAEPRDVAKHVLVVILSAAMGIQSAAVLSLGMPDISTTYMTSTLTRVVMQLARAHRGERPQGWAVARLIALIAGAALTALLLEKARAFTPALALAALASALALQLAHVTRRTGAGGGGEGGVSPEGS
jgi:uncharacterized membrane protein YoaK (UPF0700 family)